MVKDVTLNILYDIGILSFLFDRSRLFLWQKSINASLALKLKMYRFKYTQTQIQTHSPLKIYIRQHFHFDNNSNMFIQIANYHKNVIEFDIKLFRDDTERYANVKE